ncbi:neprilysin-2-like isoform X3 [Daktulosphaira vitifoliae]|nr:neprilysin-2-like isoform X3 [Daktulosphaira vitifoliae]
MAADEKYNACRYYDNRDDSQEADINQTKLLRSTAVQTIEYLYSNTNEKCRMARTVSKINQEEQNKDFVSISSKKNRILKKIHEVFKKTSKVTLSVVIFILIILSALLLKGLNNKPTIYSTCQSDECLISATTIMQSMNSAVDPCDDFYEFACGNWQDRYLSVSGQTNSWFIERTRYISIIITKILEEINQENDLRSIKQARLLYKTCLNTDLLNKVGYKPIYKILKKLELPQTFPDFSTATSDNGTSFNIARTLGLAQRYLSADILIQISLEPDPSEKLSTLYLGPANGASTPLPDELLVDYKKQWPSAMATDLSARAILLLKVKYMVSVISELVGDSNSNTTSMAVTVLKILVLESKLKREQSQQSTLTKFKLSDLKDYMISNSSDILEENTFDWMSYIQAITEGINKTLSMNDIVYVRDPNYFLVLQSLMANEALEEFQQLIWWKIIEILVPHTTNTMRSLKNSFIDSIFQTDRQPTRSTTCTEVTKTFFNLPIAYKFYTRDDMQESTTKVRKMLEQLQRSFKNMIKASNWTDYATKIVISKKVDAIKAEIGYPEIFKSPSKLNMLYDHIDIQEDQYLQSMLNIKSFEVGKILEAIGKPINNSEIHSSLTEPLEVNAFYSRLYNSITIPAGILQMPFYYKGVDVINYGAIGSILGHEMTHGFDIEGKNYDINGKKTMWWGQQTFREYLKRAQCFIKEYDKFSISKDIRLNGSQTLAENMADTIGLKQAWLAYKIFQSENKERLPGLKGFTNDQQFFLAYANVWCHKTNAKYYELQVHDDHSPNNIRVIGSLRNNPDFSAVWKCPSDSPMNPSKKCVMW